MRLVNVKSHEEMSTFAAGRILEKVKSGSSVSLGLATGETPVRTYELLIEDYKKNHTSYQHVNSYNLDEYAGIAPDHPNSYHYFMHENLFNHINIPKENIHIPNGRADHIEKEAKRYESIIDEIGGVDLQLLGIGENGHIGFNEPGTLFDTVTHIVELTESTRQANARYFNESSEVPTHAITMGIATILKSKEIMLLASGKQKAEAIYQMFTGEISVNCPASVLQNHPNVIIVADEEATSKLEKKLNFS
ncbi:MULTISPECIES: glucosamine-6-phosphate deaminase [Bacillaceae]|uniref:Glucosamine-6-phosphate deaminase n=1 Tax=Domibacillus aminovorans TaxID=29332 RepID=A0A177KRN8_9BACI|nr:MULTISPECIES: glucosamine-6-phosphate deaminase [Bacillaceae]OAH55716.1 glucosamine-6-phosphate deaminase [Domibacillus aminovorans]